MSRTTSATEPNFIPQTQTLCVQLNLLQGTTRVVCEISEDGSEWALLDLFEVTNDYPLIELPKVENWTFQAKGFNEEGSLTSVAISTIQNLTFNAVLPLLPA